MWGIIKILAHGGGGIRIRIKTWHACEQWVMKMFSDVFRLQPPHRENKGRADSAKTWLPLGMLRFPSFRNKLNSLKIQITHHFQQLPVFYEWKMGHFSESWLIILVGNNFVDRKCCSRIFRIKTETLTIEIIWLEFVFVEWLEYLLKFRTDFG